MSEFGLRYAAARRSAQRYRTALNTLTAGTVEHDSVADGMPAVQGFLERAIRLCEHGTAAGEARPRRRNLTRRQRLTPRQRHLHNLNGCLIALEVAADAAVRVAVVSALASLVAPQTETTDVDEAIAALAKALDELR
jgi:hypothetical protein